MKNMRKKRSLNLLSVSILVLILALNFSACHRNKKKVTLSPEDLGTDKELYEKAKAKSKRDSEKARMLFKEIIHLYPDSAYARRAKIGIADTYFKQKDSASYIMAATEYEEYVSLYPNSPDAVYAKYQTAMCYYNQMPKPGRDQANTILAVKALENMIKLYPDTKEAEDAKIKLETARQNLAAHYCGIGITNFKIEALLGAVARFKQVIDEYPDFKENDKLFYYTGKCYLRLRSYDTAASFFQKVINSYPRSKYLKKSKALLKKAMLLEEERKKKQAEAPKEKGGEIKKNN